MIAPLKPVLLLAAGATLWACSQTQEPNSSSPATSSKTCLLGGISPSGGQSDRNRCGGLQTGSTRIGVGREGGLRRRSLLEDFFAAAGTGGGGAGSSR